MSPPPRPPGTPRELLDFLKVGDADLGAGRPRHPAMQIGRGFPEARPVAAAGGGDPASAREWAVWAWVRRLSMP
jgi:hypothetical protein